MSARRPLLLLLIAVGSGSHAWGTDWTLIRFEGRDYVPLREVAHFYDFAVDEAPEHQLALPEYKTVSLDSGVHQLEVKLDSREAVINGVKHWLSFPVRLHTDQLIVSRLDLVKTIEPMLRPQKIAGLRPVWNVVLDPGHGGHDKGAGCSKGLEKHFALDVCRRARPLLLAQGVNAMLTRDSDEFIALEERPRIARRYSNCVLVSVHFNNSNTNPFASGVEVFSLTPRGAPSTDSTALGLSDLRNEPGNAVDLPSAALGASIHHALLGHLAQPDRGLKRQRFAVIRLSTVPSVLVEGGFLSNAADRELIASAAWRERLAAAIVDGILNYKKLAEKRQPPKLLAEYRRENPAGVSLQLLPRPPGTALPQAIIPSTN